MSSNPIFTQLLHEFGGRVGSWSIPKPIEWEPSNEFLVDTLYESELDRINAIGSPTGGGIVSSLEHGDYCQCSTKNRETLTAEECPYEFLVREGLMPGHKSFWATTTEDEFRW